MFLFTDVEGSTRLLEELGPDRYAVALADHRRIVREACVSLGGVEVDTQGDAFLVAFARAPDALQAATVITERLEEEPIRVRMGLHTGTPLVTVRGGGSASCGPDRGGGPWQAGAGERSAATLVETPLRDLGEHRRRSGCSSWGRGRFRR